MCVRRFCCSTLTINTVCDLFGKILKIFTWFTVHWALVDSQFCQATSQLHCSIYSRSTYSICCCRKAECFPFRFPNSSIIMNSITHEALLTGWSVYAMIWKLTQRSLLPKKIALKVSETKVSDLVFVVDSLEIINHWILDLVCALLLKIHVSWKWLYIISFLWCFTSVCLCEQKKLVGLHRSFFHLRMDVCVCVCVCVDGWMWM